MDEFKFYIQKMQKLLKNDKIQPLLTRRKSQKLVQQFSISVEEKRDKIDKIKSLIKENKREVNSKEIANQYLQEINKQENQNKAEIIMKEDIINQEESFKKRLEEKRLLRGNSQPHMKLKAKFNNGEKKILPIDTDSILSNENFKPDSKKNSIKKTGKTPTKRQSILTANVLGDQNYDNTVNTFTQFKPKSKKPNLEINLTAEKVHNPGSNLVVNEDNINEIFDQDYEENIESSLLKVWESAQKEMRQELEKIEEEMSQLLDSLADEKFRKTMEINNKFELELRELRDDLDLKDENNVNTIIYNELVRDKEAELQETYKDLDDRKKIGLQKLKDKSAQIKDNYEKMKHISKIKSDIAQGIKSKIIKSLTPKETLNKKFDFSNVKYDSNSNNLATAKNHPAKIEFSRKSNHYQSKNEFKKDITDLSPSDSDDSEEDEAVGEITKKVFKPKEARISNDKQTNANTSANSRSSYEKRVSRGYIASGSLRKDSKKVVNEI